MLIVFRAAVTVFSMVEALIVQRSVLVDGSIFFVNSTFLLVYKVGDPVFLTSIFAHGS